MAEAGTRDRRLTLYAVSDSAGSSGFPVETLTLITTVWASRADVAGDERFANDQLSAPFTTKWIVPYSEQWDPELVNVCKTRWASFEGRFYDIVRAERTGRQHDDIALWTLARQG